MIFVTDKGRMANNIFQYAHLYAWAREHGRKTMSMRFAYKYPDFRISHTRYHSPVVYVLAKLAARLGLIPTVDFDGSDNHQIQRVQAARNVLVTGWWIRYPDLVMKYMDDIVSLFDFMPNVRRLVTATLQQSSASSLKLGVHIRRGDYKVLCNGRYFFDDSHYVQVIRRVAELLAARQVDVYICTNDPQLDHAYYLNHLAPLRVFFPAGTPAEDLCLLSECDYLVGPPSSYTLIASMYRDTPLYWMQGDLTTLTLQAFHGFDYQMRHFDECFFSL